MEARKIASILCFVLENHAMASDLRVFLLPSFEKLLVFLVFAFLLVPAAYYVSKGGVYCYQGVPPAPAVESCEQAQISFGTWHASWSFVIADTLESVVRLMRGVFFPAPFLLAIPLIGAFLSYLISCSLVHFFEPKLGD